MAYHREKNSQKMIKAPTSWSYTFLSNFENCPRKAWHMYVAKDLPFQETEQMKWGSRVHKAMELRLKERKPLEQEMAVYEPFASAFDGKNVMAEEWFQINIKGEVTAAFAKDTWGKGKADVVVLSGDTAAIFDWKTGKVREDPFELRVFGMLAKARWPGLRKITGHYVWLGDQKVGAKHDLTDTGATYAGIREIWSRVEALDAETEWLPTPNPLCGFCPVKKCEFNRTR